MVPMNKPKTGDISFPSAEEFMARLNELAESELTESDIFESASNGTLHRLLGLPANAFEPAEDVSIFIPVGAQTPITSKDFLRETGAPTGAMTHTKQDGVGSDAQLDEVRKSRVIDLAARRPASGAIHSPIRDFAKRAPSRFYPTHPAHRYESGGVPA